MKIKILYTESDADYINVFKGSFHASANIIFSGRMDRSFVFLDIFIYKFSTIINHGTTIMLSFYNNINNHCERVEILIGYYDKTF